VPLPDGAGIFPASVFGFLIVQPRLPCVRVVGAQASATFFFPYWRQFSRWLGSVHAKSRAIVGVLRGGRSCCTFMDGIHGMFAGTMGAKERLFVSSKKGLVRLALQTGTPLVPCYCFGQTRLVRTGQDRFGLLMALSRRLGVSLVLPLGRGLLPIPFRTPLTLALGSPIDVPKMEGPPEPALVDALHAQLLRETRALFERHRAACGYEGSEIEVL
jgi:2-acylglycerol O-acyltransferase 2